MHISVKAPVFIRCVFLWGKLCITPVDPVCTVHYNSDGL